jgi:hypothetical protein
LILLAGVYFGPVPKKGAGDAEHYKYLPTEVIKRQLLELCNSVAGDLRCGYEKVVGWY